nr:hypothetical protein [Plantactinospora soyae]
MYRISEAPQTASTATDRVGAVRPLLWLFAVLGAAANVVSSAAGVNMFIGAGFGLVTLACAAALIVDHYRHRSR